MTMSTPRYKAALIGCGNRSRMHVRSYEHVQDAVMTACCDLIEERRTGHAARVRPDSVCRRGRR